MLLFLLSRSGFYEFISLEEIRNLRAEYALHLIRGRLSEAHAVKEVVLVQHIELAVGA